jgi:hypothetical protein
MEEKHLAGDFCFYSPAGIGIDLSTCWTRCWPNAEMIAAFEFKRIIDCGEEVVVTYEAPTLPPLRQLLQRPAVAVGVAEEHEPPPGELLNLAHLRVFGEQLRAGLVGAGHHQPEAGDRARLRVDDPLADRDRARGAGRGELRR